MYPRPVPVSLPWCSEARTPSPGHPPHSCGPPGNPQPLPSGLTQLLIILACLPVLQAELPALLTEHSHHPLGLTHNHASVLPKFTFASTLSLDSPACP